jgi:N-acetylglucosamine-6-sulfatase
VVLIVTDDQRAGTLRFMPTVQAELVSKGVVYPNAFVVNPLCCPSRASILTGEWSHTTGVWGNETAVGGASGGAFDDAETLPVWLDRIGYRTGLIGKYLNGFRQGRQPDYVPPGWDYFAIGSSPDSYYDFTFKDAEYHGVYHTDVLAADAVEFIRSAGPEPFFLYFATRAPHVNNFSRSWFDTDVAERHAGEMAGRTRPSPAVNESRVRDKPSYIRRRLKVALSDLARLREGQLGALLSVDDAVAAMLDVLRETGKLDNTIIVYTSDNGYSWGEHRWVQKTAPYEESLRVPLVIRHGSRAGVDWRFALNVDLAETIVRATGGRVRTAGRNLFSTWRRPRFLFEHADHPWVVPSYCGFRGRAWKYVQYGFGAEELYDLRTDRHEMRSLHRVRPRLVRVFRRMVRESPCRPPAFRPK